MEGGGIMKSFFFPFFVLTVLLPGATEGNPVVEHHMSELVFNESSDWHIEFFLLESFEGCMLTTMTDTAWINPDILYEDYIVLDANDLLQPLRIDPDGDILSLWLPGIWPQYPIDELRFGDQPNAEIAAPPAGYSISNLSYIRYLDASPTPGEPNDTLDAMGDIIGTVYDSTGNPVPGVEVIYDTDVNTGEPVSTITDVSGEFTIHTLASVRFLSFICESCPTESRSVQVWPDSTVEISVSLDCAMNSPVYPDENGYEISSNPNPVFEEVTFSYKLRDSGPHSIAIYDLRGSLVELLTEEYGTAGSHTVRWNPGYIPAGVYLCRLEAGPVTKITKCVVWK